MSSPATNPIGGIINVIVEIAPIAPVSPTFNQGLVIGSSAVIPSFGGNFPRIRQYSAATFSAQMLTDGFTTNSPEYIAAQIYFSQSPQPQVIWVGRQDTTSIASVTVGNSGGSGYNNGDVLTVIQGGASAGQVKVSVTAGAVTGITAIAQDGTGYSVANNLATTGGAGTGCTIDITAIGETPLVALQYCRNASSSWWAAMSTTAIKADHEAIAAFVQSMQPVGCYFYSTGDADALAGSTGNVFSVLKAANYNRVLGQYNTTQGGLAPNNIYAAAAAMGVAMGLNTGLANSAFTMKFKQQVGITTEPVSATAIGVIEGNNGNLYLNYGNTYQLLEQGVVPNGQYFDEILFLDMLVSNIQFNVMNLLTENPKIAQTNAGQTQLIQAVSEACEASLVIGFIGPGTWEGAPINFGNGTGLSAGAALPKGYAVLSPPYSQQSASDQAARKSMPIYVALNEAGAVHSVLIGIFVQR